MREWWKEDLLSDSPGLLLSSNLQPACGAQIGTTKGDRRKDRKTVGVCSDIRSNMTEETISDNWEPVNGTDCRCCIKLSHWFPCFPCSDSGGHLNTAVIVPIQANMNNTVSQLYTVTSKVWKNHLQEIKLNSTCCNQASTWTYSLVHIDLN